jgi:hypothetical protein
MQAIRRDVKRRGQAAGLDDSGTVRDVLRILGQLASSVALVFAAEALLGTTYVAGFLSGFGVSLTTIRLDPGSAVVSALIPSIYLAPAALVAFGYVFSVAVGLAAPDDEEARSRRLGRQGFRAKYLDEELTEGVGYALVAAVVSVAVLAGTLFLLNLPRSPEVFLLNVIAPAALSVVLIFPAHWIVTGTTFGPGTRVWWATLGIIVWGIVGTIVTYLLGTAVARQYSDELRSSAPLGQQVTLRDAIQTLPASGLPTSLGGTTYDAVVLLFRDEQAWLFAIRDANAPRGYRTVLIPAIQVVAYTQQ